MPTLTSIDSSYPSIVLTKPMTTIGKSPANDVVLTEGDLLESHAIIHCDGTSFFVQGAERKAQIYINGKHRKRHELTDGDLLQIGHIKYRFDIYKEGNKVDSENEAEDSLCLDGFRKLSQLSEKLLDNYDITSLLDELMDAVIELTQADKGFIILLDEENPSQLRIAAARNIKQQNVESPQSIISDSILAKVIDLKRPIIVSDALDDEEFCKSQSVINLKLCSVMCVPLTVRGKLLGLIYVGNDRIANLFEEAHLEILSTFVAQASLIVSNAMLVEQLQFDNANLTKQLKEHRFGSIIGSCEAMKQVFTTLEKVAPTNISVLVVGETGTGKEMIANELHLRSDRRDGPFITINCGAIPENLLESELFGHVKGAFTGASTTRDGRFQAANHGTVFLDEIGEMPLNLQVKLLRVLQERRVTKIGSNTPEEIDIRIIAATNRDLEQSIKEGKFREDLYYRLNVILLQLPPLRERGNDIALIAQYLCKTISSDLSLPPKNLSSQAVASLLRFNWPGNIRQLENRIRKAIVLSEGNEITPTDLGFSEEEREEAPLTLSEAKEKFALAYILDALERHDGNRSKAAEELGVDPRTIYRYLGKEQSCNNS